MRSTFTFNGHCCDEFGIYISKKPNINRSQRKFQSASVAGRNGNIYQFQDAWDEVVVTYDIFAGGYEKGDAPRDFTAIMEWLNSADDYAMLTDSYDEAHYRMAVFVDATNIEQKWYSTGQAQIKFRCKPQHYQVGEVVSVEDGDTITNPTNHVALPIITIKGNGARNELDLKTRTLMDGPVTDIDGALRLFINLDSENKTAFVKKWGSRPNFVYYAGTGSNTGSITAIGNTDGELAFTTADNSFGVGILGKVQPNIEYTISLTSATAGKIIVWFAEPSGYYNIISSAEKAFASGSSSFTFKTPVECGCILVGFYTTSGTTASFSNIMLAKGTAARPFRPLTADTLNTFQIGDTLLQFNTNGFDEVVINCEREDFALDGYSNNMAASVLDQYGNLAVEFLRLVKGENAVAFTGDIDSVVLDPRFWEL